MSNDKEHIVTIVLVTIVVILAAFLIYDGHNRRNKQDIVDNSEMTSEINSEVEIEEEISSEIE